MRKIFISFLGLGRQIRSEEDYKVPGYDKVKYTIDGKKYPKTMFSQKIILNHCDIKSFDKIILLMTKDSERRHFNLLLDELNSIGLKKSQLETNASFTENMSEKEQWRWFENLLNIINPGDSVVFDFTHGFRSVPIIFSTAISFIQKVKKINLLKAYYGYVYNRENGLGEIIDMSGFYQINEWADGIMQFTEFADTTKLASLAKDKKSSSFSYLQNSELIEALNNLSKVVKNIDAHNVAKTASSALEIINEKIDDAPNSSKILLNLVNEKFNELTCKLPISKTYDLDYFNVQISFLKLLNSHGLYSQSFTAMRELIGSIGMLGAKEKYKKNMHNKMGRNGRRNYAEPFIAMIQVEKEKWNFKGDLVKRVEELMVFYDYLENLTCIEKLKNISPALQSLRNSYAHAWTASASLDDKTLATIPKTADLCLKTFEEIIKILAQDGSYL